MRRGTRGCAAWVTAAVLLAGCAQPGAAHRTRDAETWIEGFDAAYAVGDQGLYLAPEITLDAVMMGDFRYWAQGRRDVVGLMDTVGAAEKIAGSLYLSSDGVARAYSLVWWEPETYPTTLRSSVQLMAVSDDGITELTHLAPTWLDYTVSYRQPVAIAAAERVAAEYVAAWSSGAAADIARIYAPDAVLVDGLLGVGATGSTDIGALMSASAPIAAVPTHEMFTDGVVALMPVGAWASPAVFFAITQDHPNEAHRVLLVVQSESACPGRVMIALQLDSKHRIVREERFHLVESISSCLGPISDVAVWWTGLELPLPFDQRITARVDTEVGVINVCNGSSACESSVRWAVGRFVWAGIPLPTVSSVTFDPLDERCDAALGHAERSNGFTAILICADPFAAEQPAEQSEPEPITGLAHLLLHEFSHAWLNEHIDGRTEKLFTAHVGLGSWNDRSAAWHDRAVEWAAETLAWGLRGTAGRALSLGNPDCQLLADGYRILTGVDPLTPCQGVDAAH